MAGKGPFWINSLITDILRRVFHIGQDNAWKNCLWLLACNLMETTQSAFTSSNLTIETPEQGVKYVQS